MILRIVLKSYPANELLKLSRLHFKHVLISQTTWGICVLLPLPVSPTMTDMPFVLITSASCK